MTQLRSAYPCPCTFETSLEGIPPTVNSTSCPCCASKPRRKIWLALPSPPCCERKKPGARERNSAALPRGTARSSPMSRLNSDAARAGPVPRTVAPSGSCARTSPERESRVKSGASKSRRDTRSPCVTRAGARIQHACYRRAGGQIRASHANGCTPCGPRRSPTSGSRVLAPTALSRALPHAAVSRGNREALPPSPSLPPPRGKGGEALSQEWSIRLQVLGVQCFSRRIARLPFAWTISPTGVLHPSPEAGEGTGMGAMTVFSP
jgi:hypothetical protein